MKNTKQQPVASSRGRRNSDVLVYEPAKKTAQKPEIKIESKPRHRDPIGIRMGYAQMTSHDSFVRANGFDFE